MPAKRSSAGRRNSSKQQTGRRPGRPANNKVPKENATGKVVADEELEQGEAGQDDEGETEAQAQPEAEFGDDREAEIAMADAAEPIADAEPLESLTLGQD